MRTALFLAAGMTLAADWPQYRGPTRDDISPETGLLKEWPATGPSLLWTFSDAGVGYSPPAVVGDRVYLTGGRGDNELLIAVDTKTIRDGVRDVWTAEIGPTFRGGKNNSWSAGPSASPTVDGDAVYALGGNGDLICAAASDGKVRWRKNLPKDLTGQVNPIGGGPPNLGWGFTGSPLIDGDRLICAPGGPKGTLAALDKKTGEVVWRSVGLTDQAAYTSPMPMEVDGVKQYAILTNFGLYGVAAKEGAILWRHTRKPGYGTEVINTPMVKENLLYTTVAVGNGGCEVVKIERDGDTFKATSVYANKNMLNHHGNVVLVGGHVYGASQGKGWVCQNFDTGEIVWSEQRKLPAGAVTFADGKLYCFSENDGTTVLIDASPAGWKESGRFKLPMASKQRRPQGKVWTPPVVSDGKLFLRDQEMVFCFDIKAK